MYVLTGGKIPLMTTHRMALYSAFRFGDVGNFRYNFNIEINASTQMLQLEEKNNLKNIHKYIDFNASLHIAHFSNIKSN